MSKEIRDDAESICPPISAKHAKYIAKHIKKLRAQCSSFNHCLDELYSKENTLLILQGKDIELDHICSLVDPNEEKKQFACNRKEEEMIRKDLQTHLDELINNEEDNHEGTDHSHAKTLQLRQGGKDNDHTRLPGRVSDLDINRKKNTGSDKVNASKNEPTLASGRESERHDHGSSSKARLDPNDHHKQEWLDLGNCIREKYPDIGSVEAVCKLQRNSTRQLCGSHAIRHAVESFFNKQLRHLQCTCDALPSESSSLPLTIGGAAGGFVFLCLLVTLCCWVSRSKKGSKRKKNHKKEGPVSYHVSEKDENVSFYSEISDVTMPLNNFRREMARQEQTNKPNLPTRYAKVPGPMNPSTKELAGSIEYLEPWDSPRFSLAEVNYGVDQSRREDQDVPDEHSNRGSYFIPLDGNTHDHEDCGYETLTRNKKAKEKAEEVKISSKEESNAPDYFVLEKNDDK